MNGKCGTEPIAFWKLCVKNTSQEAPNATSPPGFVATRHEKLEKNKVRDKPTATSPQGLVAVSWKISEFKEVRNVPVAISLRGLVAAVVSKFEF